MFFDKPLFKKDCFDSVKDRISFAIILCSINSALGILLLSDVVKNSLSVLYIEDVISCISSNLLSKNFIKEIDQLEICISSDFNIVDENRHDTFYTPSEMLLSDISSLKFDLLQAKFFYYYFTRMPILLKKTYFGPDHSIPNDSERKQILRACVDALEKHYPQLVEKFPHIFSAPNLIYDLARDINKANGLTSYFKNKKSREEFIYDYHWIFFGPSNTEEHLLLLEKGNPNFQFIMKNILDKYFPVFWNCFRDYYADNICFLATVK